MISFFSIRRSLHFNQRPSPAAAAAAAAITAAAAATAGYKV